MVCSRGESLTHYGKTMRRLSSVITAAAILSFPTVAYAGSYQALCGGAKCTVIVGPELIRSPYGSIPTNRVTNWGGGGDTDTQVGTGVATTLLFGPIGLLGFLAKKHDYNFVVNGYDGEGKKTSMSVQFKNDKPAKRFMNEMRQVTQLGMGQTKSAKEIMSTEANMASGISTGTLEGDAQSQDSNIKVAKRPTSTNCWSEYLVRNPAMEQWAKANPAMAAQNKKNFDDC